MAKAKVGQVAGVGKGSKKNDGPEKKTSIGRSRNSRPINKSKKNRTKLYRGQGI